MKKSSKYILLISVFLLIFQYDACAYISGRTQPLTVQEKSFLADFFSTNFLLTIFNLLYLIVFSFWVNKQKIGEEVLLLQVRGKYTKMNVLLWIERIENKYGFRLVKTRKRVQSYTNKAKRVKRGIVIYRKHIDSLIIKYAYGEKRTKNAFSAMHKYTKLLLFGQLFQIIISMFYASVFWANELNDLIGGIFTGITMSLFIGVVYWIVSGLIIGLVLNQIAKAKVKKNGHAGYWHIVTAQLVAFGGFWTYVPIPQKALMAITDIEIKGGSTKIVFKNFKGGGSQGTW